MAVIGSSPEMQIENSRDVTHSKLFAVVWEERHGGHWVGGDANKSSKTLLMSHDRDIIDTFPLRLGATTPGIAMRDSTQMHVEGAAIAKLDGQPEGLGMKTDPLASWSPA